jgi:hypothetical protein
MSEKNPNRKNLAHNAEGANAYQSYIASLIEQTQIEKENPQRTDFEPLGKTDLTPDAFTEKGTDYPADASINAETELPVGKSMDRFSKSHPIDQEEMKQNKGMRLNQKTHSPADGE